MAQDKFVEGGDSDTAVLLLAAAQELGLDPSVVVFSPDGGGFTVPAEVAAKVDKDNDGKGKQAAKKAAPKTRE